MRVLLVNDIIRDAGGAEVVVKSLKELLERDGHEVLTYGDDRDSETFGTFFSRWFSINHYLKVQKIIRDFKPDIVHVHNCNRYISPSVCVAAKRMGVPVIMTIHDFHIVCPLTWMVFEDKKPCKHGFGSICLKSSCYSFFPNASFGFKLLKWLKVYLHRIILKRYVDHFTCPSRILTEWFGNSLDLRNVSYVPNFTKIIADKPDTKSSSNDLLFVGRLSVEKGVDILLDALKLVSDMSIDYMMKIVGDGALRKELEEKVGKLGLSDNVVFLGRIPNDELKFYYADSCCVVMPSIWMENNPIVAFEAMVSSSMIIASNIGGFPDLVEDSVTGLLFNPGDSKDLSEKIMQVINDPEKTAEMGRAGHLKLSDEFTAEKHLEKTMEIYKSIL